MKKNLLPCANCGRAVILKKLVPLYKKQSKLLITDAPLSNYEYTCPYCKATMVYDKDYVREVWQELNPTKLTARKL